MVSLSTKWRGPGSGGSPEQPGSREQSGAQESGDTDAPTDDSTADRDESASATPEGERLSGTSLADLVQAHSEVLEAEQRARHPHANPLAQPRLAAAKKVEQELLTRLGFLTFAEATASGFRAPPQRLDDDAEDSDREDETPAAGEVAGERSGAQAFEAPTPRFRAPAPAPDRSTGAPAPTFREPGPAPDRSTGAPDRSTGAPAPTFREPAPAPDRSTTDQHAEPSSRDEQKGDRLMDTSPTDAGRSRFWNQEDEADTDRHDGGGVPDELLTRLLASAAEFVEAEARRAQVTAADIVEAARVEARASADLSRKLEETAAATAAATAGDLINLLSLIDDLKVKLDATQAEVQSRVELFRMASGKLQKPGIVR